MEDRRLDHLRNFRAVLVERINLFMSSKANLVIDDNVHTAAGLETAGL